jgi:hypothetical protein
MSRRCDVSPHSEVLICKDAPREDVNPRAVSWHSTVAAGRRGRSPGTPIGLIGSRGEYRPDLSSWLSDEWRNGMIGHPRVLRAAVALGVAIGVGLTARSLTAGVETTEFFCLPHEECKCLGTSCMPGQPIGVDCEGSGSLDCR